MRVERESAAVAMRALVLALLLPWLLALAACTARTSVQGGATNNDGAAHVTIGLPF